MNFFKKNLKSFFNFVHNAYSFISLKLVDERVQEVDSQLKAVIWKANENHVKNYSRDNTDLVLHFFLSFSFLTTQDHTEMK